MGHTCEKCGSVCFCDLEDSELDEQPEDCPHLREFGGCDDELEDQDGWED